MPRLKIKYIKIHRATGVSPWVSTNKIDGVTFDEAEKDKIIIDLDGLSVPIISKQKLIINKRSTEREKDRLDAETLSRKLFFV